MIIQIMQSTILVKNIAYQVNISFLLFLPFGSAMCKLFLEGQAWFFLMSGKWRDNFFKRRDFEEQICPFFCPCFDISVLVISNEFVWTLP